MPTVEQFRDELRQRAVDLEVVNEHGIGPLEAHAAKVGTPVDPWLDALDRYLRALGRESYWSPLRFVVEPVAECAGPDAAAFGRLLSQVAALLQALGDNTTRTEQYGVRFAAAALPGRPADFAAALDLAVEFAAKGHDLGWYLQLVVPALAKPTAPDGAAAGHFLEGLGRHAKALRTLVDRQSLVGYQVAVGLAAMAEVDVGVAVTGWLDTLTQLPKPGPVFEHGVPTVVRAGLTAEQVTRVFEVALLLADRGLEPLPLLQVPPRDELMVELAEELAGEGIDPAAALAWGVPNFAEWGWLADDGERLVALAKSLKAHGLSTRRMFEEGLPPLRHLEERWGLGTRGLELAEKLAAAGFEPVLTLAFGLGRALHDADRYPFLAKGALDTAHRLADRGINPDAALSYAFRPLGELAKGHPSEFERLQRALESLIVGLEAMGISSNEVLFHDVRGLIEVGTESAAFLQLGPQVQHVLNVWVEAKLDPQALVAEALPAALRAAAHRPWVLTEALALVERLVAEGRATAALDVLTEGLASASLAFGADASGLSAVLTTLESHTRALPREFINPVSSAVCLIAKQDVGLLTELLKTVTAKLGSARSERQGDVSATVAHALPALSVLVTDVASFEAVLSTALAATDRVATEQLDAWRSGALAAAALLSFDEALRALERFTAFAEDPEVLKFAPALTRLTDRADELVRALTRLKSAQRAFRTPALLKLMTSVAVQGHDVDDWCERLDTLEPLLVQADASAPLVEGLRRMEPTLARLPEAWAGLVKPILTAHQSRAGALLSHVAMLGSRYLTSAADCDVLREVVTQLGVRALDAMQGLIVPGLFSGRLPGLASHAKELRLYLRDVGFHQPELFAKYLDIQRDRTLSEAARAQKSVALREQVERLAQQVKRGDVGDEQLDDPLLGVAVIHLFPPAASVTQQHVVGLMRTFDDRPQDVAAWPGPPGLTLEVPSGGYRLRPGHPLDTRPWEMANALLGQLPDRVHPTDEALGAALLRAWADGQLARPAHKRALLAELFHSLAEGHGPSPSVGLESATQLLGLRDLLADRCAERIERALLAARAASPQSYARLVEAKLAPKTTVTPKLVKSVTKTLDAWREGLDAAEAQRRLRAQLPHLVLDERALSTLRDAVDPAALTTALSALPAKATTVEAGKEVVRVHADLVGQDLKAMHAVLFGQAGQPGALEYHESAGALSLTLEVTKRRAHAAIGFAEGVCVATDERLWQRPDFLQTIFWSSAGIAQGGMHLLVVEDAGQRYLSLPGINPSNSLLDEVEPQTLVRVLLRAACRLARQWQLGGVWVPTATSIASNRRAVLAALEGLGLPQKNTKLQALSYSPFAYSFDSVWVVDEAKLEATPKFT